MKKFLIVVMSVIMLFCVACNSNSASNSGSKPNGEDGVSIPDATVGYTEALGLRLTIAEFKYGTEIPYNRYTNVDKDAPDTVKDAWHARWFRDFKPEYSYTPFAFDEQLEYKSTSTWASKDSAEDSNYFVIYPENGGTENGKVVSDYMLYIPFSGAKEKYENVLNLYNYDTLTFRMKAQRATEIKISASDRKSGKMHVLYSGTLSQDKATDIAVNLTEFDKNELTSLEFFRFEYVVDLKDGQTNRIDYYRIEATAEESYEGNRIIVDGLGIESEYLGNMLYCKWGAYSASGFYDTDDKKWKIWFGAGIPECVASDNVYYSECSDLSKPWSKPIRVHLDDHGLLFPQDVGPGYGGDPGIVKVNGTYYMYFSALPTGLDDGIRKHWNKVYLATSTDGIDWELHDTPIADAPTGGGAGYGAGSPSVIYKDGVFRVYYYTQCTEANGNTGFLMKESTDGYTFGESVQTNSPYGAGDVKFVPSLNKWVMAYYTVERYAESLDQTETVRIAVSDDGITWQFDAAAEIAQNDDIPSCHNPGFIGTEHGLGFENMFVTYGANDIPLVFMDGAQYDARMLEWSRISLYKIL